MLDRLFALFEETPRAPPDTVGTPFQRRQIAVVALLIEIARSDRRLAAEELATIQRIVREWFGLDAPAAARLIEVVMRELDAALEDWVFAAAVRDGFSARERAAIVGLLWEVVYADGRLARLEASLMRRLAEALDIAEADRERARAEAFARASWSRGPASGRTEAE